MDSVEMLVPWVFQFAAFVTDVPDILVTAVYFFCSLADRNVVSLGVFDQIFPGAEIPESPWRDDLDRRIEGLDGGLETNLVVYVTGTAMRDV